MIATLRQIVLDCPDPKALAEFYAALLGGEFGSCGRSTTMRVVHAAELVGATVQLPPEVSGLTGW